MHENKFQKSERLGHKFRATEKILKDLALDRNNDILKIALREDGSLNVYLSPQDISHIRMDVNGIPVSEGGTGSMLGRALLGGLVAGPLGAVVAGATTHRKESTKVVNILVHIGADFFDNGEIGFALYELHPFIPFQLYSTPGGAQQAGQSLIDWLNAAKAATLNTAALHWSGSSAADVKEVADTLSKLQDLLQQGLITQEQFNSARDRLFGSQG